MSRRRSILDYTIRLFAGLAERIGSACITIPADSQPLTADELKQRIAATYPEAAAAIASSFIARNRAYAPADEAVLPADELALIPPVSGGQPAAEPEAGTAPLYRLTYDPLTVEQTAAQVGDPDHGATIVFVGTTRGLTFGVRTVRLEYEAYEPMALATMEQIGAELDARWPGTRCAIAHRLGLVAVGEASVVIAVSTPHRAAAYEASRYAIDRLKQIVPIWKKEIWEDGSEWKGHQLGPWDPLAPRT